MEEWKWIVYNGHNFKNKYMVSNIGRVKSVDKYSERQHQFYAGRILKQRTNNRKSPKYSHTQYQTVTLWDNGKQVDIEVHRLVATMFIPNPKGMKYVNHKDGNGTNNDVSNLEWCTASDNARHSVDVLGNNPKKWKAKPVIQRNLNGNIINTWESAWEIQRQLGFCQVSISRCCRREKKSGEMYGYIWDFA